MFTHSIVPNVLSVETSSFNEFRIQLVIKHKYRFFSYSPVVCRRINRWVFHGSCVALESQPMLTRIPLDPAYSSSITKFCTASVIKHNLVLLLSCLFNRKLLPGGNHSVSSSSLVPMPATLSFRVWRLKRSTISEGELASSGFLSVLAEINLGKRMEIPRDGWTRPTPAWCTGDIVRSAFQQLTIEKMLLYLSSNIITNFQRVVFM